MELEPEMNPAMGLRAQDLPWEPDIFKTCKGILVASVFGNLKIMFPMISELRTKGKGNHGRGYERSEPGRSI